MITFSAFADEIGPDLDLQMEVCQSVGVRNIDVRGIDGKNVSTFTTSEAKAYKKRMDDRGFAVPCIGSPLGKIKISDPFGPHLELVKHCCELAHIFGSPFIRVFSFYPSDGMAIADQRPQVFERMTAMLDVTRQADLVMLHENERDIYGAKPAGVMDLMAKLRCDHFKGIFDPANFVYEGVRPYDEGWKLGLDKLTDYFHIKDYRPGEQACTPAGHGAGQMDEIFAELGQRNWSGYMTLEPHMAAMGQFRGFTGPELFAQAVEALKSLCDRHGLKYNR